MLKIIKPNIKPNCSRQPIKCTLRPDRFRGDVKHDEEKYAQETNTTKIPIKNVLNPKYFTLNPSTT
jgi:hypothetical protein